MPEQSPESRHLPFVDLLRAFSVLYIVGFWHLMDYTDSWPGYANGLTNRLTVIVLGLFVFLSGHLLGRSRLAPGVAGLSAFLMRRLTRIYPLYLAALAVFALRGWVDPGTAVKAVLSLSILFGPSPRTLWFITMLLVFYLCAPFLIRAAENRVKFLAIASGLALCFALAVTLLPQADPRLALYFPAFALGIHGARRQPPAWPALSLALAAAIALSFVGSAPTGLNLFCAPLATLAPLAIFMIAQRLALPRVRIVEALSYASYAMYLFHRMIYPLVTHVAAGSIRLAALLLAGLPAIFAVSWLAQKAYDHALDCVSSRKQIGRDYQNNGVNKLD